MNIAVGSKNQAKIKAVENTFMELGRKVVILPMEAPSGVSIQPFSDEETMEGAASRAKFCLQQADEADMAIGLEGGVTETPFGLFLCNWGALTERGKETLFAGGARIMLPEEVAARLRSGEELGPVMDDYCQTQGIRHKEGAIGVFTNGMIDRSAMFAHITKLLIGQCDKRRESSSS